MRKLTYFVASTIDGFVAGPDGGDPSGPDGLFVFEGGHMNAILEDWPDILPAPAREALGIDPPNRRFDTVLEGRASYEVGLAAGVSDAYPHLEHYVFSRTLTKCPGPRVKLTADDPVETVRELKRRDGLGIWLCGGGTLANALRAEIDELVVNCTPSSWATASRCSAASSVANGSTSPIRRSTTAGSCT